MSHPSSPFIDGLEWYGVIQCVGVVFHLQDDPGQAIWPLLSHVDPARQLVPVKVYIVGPQ